MAMGYTQNRDYYNSSTEIVMKLCQLSSFSYSFMGFFQWHNNYQVYKTDDILVTYKKCDYGFTIFFSP